jgi:hypothetical protein
MGESPMSLMRTLTRRGSLLSLLALALCFCTLIVSAACSKSSPPPSKAKGGNENGAATNKLAEHGAEAAKMETYLRNWDAAHPKGGISTEMIEQLKALGILQVGC